MLRPNENGRATEVSTPGQSPQRASAASTAPNNSYMRPLGATPVAEPYPNAVAEFTDAAAAIYCPSCHRWDGTHGKDCPDDTADRPAILLLAKMKRPIGTLYLLTEEGASVETVYTVIVSECGTVMECHPCASYTCRHVDFVSDLGEG
jgi:hypothetical protein